MQYHQDFFEPPPLSPDLEWMLQSSQVSDADLAVKLTQDYASRLHFLALIVLGDESAAAKAVAASLQLIVRQRAQYWSQVPLRAWIYAEAMGVILHHTTPIWRLRRWLDRRRMLPSSMDRIMTLRLKLLSMHQNLLLPVSLIYGQELPESEAAYVLGISDDLLLERLTQARNSLPEHSLEELAQAARLAEADLTADQPPNPLVDPAQSNSTPPHLQRRLLSQVLPGITRQAQRGQARRLVAEAGLVGFVIVAALVVGLTALNLERENPDEVSPKGTVITEIVVIHQQVEITGTPRSGEITNDAWSHTLAQVDLASPTVTLTPTPIPEPRAAALDLSVAVSAAAPVGAVENTWENSGPVLLAVLFCYQDILADAEETSAVLRPNALDAAVFPYEIEDYIHEQIPLKVAYRFGGELETLRRMIDIGLPVLLQKTASAVNNLDGWAAEYVLVIGFDDHIQQVQMLVVRDGEVKVVQEEYASFLSDWLPFGYAYFAIYPLETAGDLVHIIGEDSSYTDHYASAIHKLGYSGNIIRLEEFWRYFAAGTILTYQGEYTQAAMKFDQSLKIYNRLAVDEQPWRAYWYNSRIYWAYFYTGQYENVISLTTSTLSLANGRGLEESLYWRAMAHNALGNQPAALLDVRNALQVHPQFGPALYLLETLETTSP